jgi:hypothetical protein
MVSRAQVRRIALALPSSREAKVGFAFSVRGKGGKEKGFAWVWQERVDPKKPRVPNPAVLAVRVADLDEKEALIALRPDKFFTEPHYAGFPAVLVRLAAVDAAEMKTLLAAAWRSVAARELVEGGEHRSPSRR